jgi:hypothetical protein
LAYTSEEGLMLEKKSRNEEGIQETENRKQGFRSAGVMEGWRRLSDGGF